MGNDGGSIPTRTDLVKTKAKTEQAEKATQLLIRWFTCALSKVRSTFALYKTSSLLSMYLRVLFQIASSGTTHRLMSTRETLQQRLRNPTPPNTLLHPPPRTTIRYRRSTGGISHPLPEGPRHPETHAQGRQWQCKGGSEEGRCPADGGEQVDVSCQLQGDERDGQIRLCQGVRLRSERGGVQGDEVDVFGGFEGEWEEQWIGGGGSGEERCGGYLPVSGMLARTSKGSIFRDFDPDKPNNGGTRIPSPPARRETEQGIRRQIVEETQIYRSHHDGGRYLRTAREESESLSSRDFIPSGPHGFAIVFHLTRAESGEGETCVVGDCESIRQRPRGGTSEDRRRCQWKEERLDD